MKILKFGGTSIENAKNISNIIDIIKSNHKSANIIVVSALGGVTEEIINITKQALEKDITFRVNSEKIFTRHIDILKSFNITDRDIFDKINDIKIKFSKIVESIYTLSESNDRIIDEIMGFGEILSSIIISKILNNEGIENKWVDSRNYIKTDSRFNSAKVNLEKSKKLLLEDFTDFKNLVFGGFIGSNSENVPTTIGRGGSDYTASILGWVFGVNIIEIWTDVDGVMSADPKIVKNAFVLDQISYEEAKELAHFGAKVIHPKTMNPAKNANIPILINNSFNTKSKGTLINNISLDNSHLIAGLSLLDDIMIINIFISDEVPVSEVTNKILNLLTDNYIDIYLSSMSPHEHALSLALNKKEYKKINKFIEDINKSSGKNKKIKKINKYEDLVMITIVGKNIIEKKGVAGMFFSTLGDNDINILTICQGSSEINISAIIQKKYGKKALCLLHDKFFNHPNIYNIQYNAN